MKTLEQLKSLVKALNYLEHLKELSKENKELSKETTETGFKLLKQQLKDAGILNLNIEYDINRVLLNELSVFEFISLKTYRNMCYDYLYKTLTTYKMGIYEYDGIEYDELIDKGTATIIQKLKCSFRLPVDATFIELDSITECIKKSRDYGFRNNNNYCIKCGYNSDTKREVVEALRFEVFKCDYTIECIKIKNHLRFDVKTYDNNIFIENIL